MPPVCPECGFENPPAMRFCGQCGTRLADDSAPGPAAVAAQQLGVMMGPDLLERFRRAGLEAAGQRRTVTVLFADLAGYTQLSEHIDPEELYALVQRFISLLAHNVYKYEGAVDKFTGDGLMALFGAPIAQENSAELAARAACDMQADMARFSAEVGGDLPRAVSVHIGLHAGPVIVGSIGSNLLMNYTAIGDTVNLARRLQEASQPGTIVASETVYQQTHMLFDYEPLPPLELKGIHRPVAAYRLLGPRDQPGPVRGVAGLRAPLVGRAREVSRLRGLVSRLVSAGDGRLALVTGEAGLGKTRLVAEVCQGLDPASVQVLEGHSLTYRRSVAYWLFTDLLRCALDAEAETPESAMRDRLRRRLQAVMGPLAAETMPFLAHLLGLRPADAGAAARLDTLDAGQLRQQLFLAVREWLVAEARQKPTLVVLEDLHWADEVSLDLLVALADSVRQAPLGIIALARPLPEGPAAGLAERLCQRLGAQCEVLPLEALSPAESEHLLQALMDVPSLPEAVRQPIVQRSAGVPFYIEEILRMLIDAGTLVREAGVWRLASGASEAASGVPDTLQGLILARFDRLTPMQRRVLQVAAVIGRQFGRAMLGAILRLAARTEGAEPAPADEALDLALAALTQRAFIVPLGHGDEYVFAHALVSDAIYTALLRRERSELHGLAGEATETLFAGRLDDQVELLARHYALSPRRERALHYTLLAGARAARGHAVEQARQYYAQALEWLPLVPHRLDQVLEAHTGLGDVLLSTGDYDGARARFQAALAAATEAPPAAAPRPNVVSGLQRRLSRTYERQGDHDQALECLAAGQQALEAAPDPEPVEAARILHDIGWIHFRRSSFDLAQQYLRQALDLVEGSSALDVVASIYNRLGGLAYSRGDWTTCAEYVRKSIAIRESISDVASLANSFNNLAVLDIEMGQYDSALENLQRSHELMRRQGQADGIAVALNNLGLLHVRRGDLDEARRALDEALEIARQIGYSSLLGSILKHRGELHLAQQDWAAAAEALHRGAALFSELGVHDQLLEVYQLLGEAALENNMLVEAQTWAERAADTYAGLGPQAARLSNNQKSEYLRFRARLAIYTGAWADAQQCLRESGAIARAVGNRLYQGRVARDLGHLVARQGEHQRAQLHYREASLLFRSVGARLEARRTDELLSAAPRR